MPRKHRIHLGDDARDVDHKIGAFVYLRASDSTNRGQVTGYCVGPGHLTYEVSWGPDGAVKTHYDFELSTSMFVQDTADNDGEDGDSTADCTDEHG